MDQLFVYDGDIDGMDTAAFSSFLNYATKVVLQELSDITLEGFDLCLSTMDFFEGRESLEIFLDNHIEKLKQYVVRSKQADSKIIINYSSDGLNIEHLYGNQTIFEKLKNFERSWGVFKVE